MVCKRWVVPQIRTMLVIASMGFNVRVGLLWNLLKIKLTVGRIKMPSGKGTYRKPGRPKKKKGKKK